MPTHARKVEDNKRKTTRFPCGNSTCRHLGTLQVEVRE